MKKRCSWFGLFVLLVTFLFAGEQSVCAAMRKYYLSKKTVDGAHALNACATGYHMASLAEIFNTSVLKYNKQLGRKSEDSGSGPPNTIFGWIRTGWVSDKSGSPGQANCSLWTDTDQGGTMVSPFNPDWNTAATNSSPWNATVGLCSNAQPVWCVEN